MATNRKRIDERILVSFDWAMKSILREKANFDVLEGFLSTLLNDNIQIISLLESEANQQHELDKYNRVDLLAVDSNKTNLVIELQYTWQSAYLKRLLYGVAKLIVENIKLGDSYEKVGKVISVSILYFPFSYESADEREYLYRGKTEFYGINTGKPLRVDMANLPKADTAQQKGVSGKRETENNEEPSKPVNIFPEYYLIEIDHFENLIKQPIDEWVYLFKNSEVREEFKSKNIQAAREKLRVMQMSEEDRAEYETFQLSRASALDVFASQHREGLKDGKEEGIQAEKRDTVRRMRAKGWNAATIAEMTGLSEMEIAQL